jgi:membrane protease YdiL (CAAX protease family)
LPSPRSIVHRVFIGKDGLRAIWSVLIFVAIFAAICAALVLVLRQLSPPPRGGNVAISEVSLQSVYINESLLAFATLLSTWIMSKIERRGRRYGYGETRRLQKFLAGLGWGVILISLLVVLLWKSGLLIIERQLIFGWDVLCYGVLWFFAFCLLGIFEESISHGFLLYTLTRGLTRFYRRVFQTRYSATLGFWTSAAILCLVFSFVHSGNPGESPFGLVSVFLIGMFVCLSIWRTGSLWCAVGIHAAWDWGQSFLFGVANSGTMNQHRLLATHPQGPAILSGGTTGPEGSILVVGVLALGIVIVVFTLPKGRYQADAENGDQSQKPPFQVPASDQL